MNAYRITLTGCAGENPIDAFEKAVPGRTLQAVKDQKQATVRVELMNGQRKSVGFYRVVAKESQKAIRIAPTDSAKQKAKKTAQRIEREKVVWDLLQSDRHPLEAFVDLDYYGAGADACWDAAHKKLDEMSDYALGVIVDRIRNGDYDDYYMLFCVIE